GDGADLETLTREQMDRRNAYWRSRTPNERLQEVMRLNIAKWGAEVFEKGVDRSKIELVSFSRYRGAGSN
ncbi:MAG: hypothetical protein ABIO36_07965, partial [Pyrinomonadaceae bacterium]